MKKVMEWQEPKKLGEGRGTLGRGGGHWRRAIKILEGQVKGKGNLHYGPEQPNFPALIIHFPMSSGVSERASE